MGGKAQSLVENREEKGRGTIIAMDVVEYREGQAVVQWMRFEAQRKGALRSIEHYPRKRVLGVRVNKESQGNRARVTPIHSTRTRCF
ncbi:BBM_1a_G0026200.mRNA.1.CDS.1 [Saccharomyces cerevisiae]|nr:BBM_1a_G0026200.mRNA.1.CDS.1 [Saccharomyces cerevisiae]CAI7089970.1 BBM_1a_G0026200.mRNA.1.CDS.1 [Saccharomyces cerevisiae]